MMCRNGRFEGKVFNTGKVCCCRFRDSILSIPELLCRRFGRFLQVASQVCCVVSPWQCMCSLNVLQLIERRIVPGRGENSNSNTAVTLGLTVTLDMFLVFW